MATPFFMYKEMKEHMVKIWVRRDLVSIQVKLIQIEQTKCFFDL